MTACAGEQPGLECRRCGARCDRRHVSEYVAADLAVLRWEVWVCGACSAEVEVLWRAPRPPVEKEEVARGG